MVGGRLGWGYIVMKNPTRPGAAVRVVRCSGAFCVFWGVIIHGFPGFSKKVIIHGFPNKVDINGCPNKIAIKEFPNKVAIRVFQTKSWPGGQFVAGK